MRTVEERFWVKVDKDGANGCWLWKAGKDRNGYGYFKNIRMVGAHRFSYELHVGKIPEGMEIDHICHNPSCVNPEHLRVASRTENCCNTPRPITNTCGFKGVSWQQDSHKWKAQIQIHGEKEYLGLFTTKEEAHLAYRKAAIRLHGAFANSGDCP